MRSVVLRADGNSEIGLGHVYRLLALAEMLKNHFSISFAIRNPNSTIKSLILSECHHVIELPGFATYIEEAHYLINNAIRANHIVTLDGYYFDTNYQQKLKSCGCFLVCIDDIHAFHFVADVVVNHSAGILRQLYSAEYYTEFLLGFDYALIREPFRDMARQKKFQNTNDNIFVSLGGADKNNEVISLLTQCSEKANDAEYHVVLGSAYCHTDELNKFVINQSLPVTLYKNVGASKMADLMSMCSAGICSPSTVCMEYLCSGGQLYLYQISDNQAGPYKSFISNGLAKSFKDFNTPLKEGSNFFIDGKSKDRFLASFSKYLPDLHGT